MMYYGNGWMIPMMIGGLILVALIILVLYLLMRSYKNQNQEGYSGYTRSSGPDPDPASRALAILAERYAKGEISDEEFRQKKSELLKP